MRVVVQYPAAAAPYPGEVAMPVHEAGVGVPDPGWRADPVPADAGPDPAAVAAMIAAKPETGGDRSCSETTKSGQPCKGRPGDDGRCAAHKET
jgi:hypothetical protein